MLMIQFVIFGIVTSVTISSDDLLFCILISGNWDSASGCLKGELVLTITPAGTQNEPSVVLLFYSSNMNIIFCHVLYSPPISMLVNRVFEISGELQAELVLTIMPDAPWVSSYCRIQSICCYACYIYAICCYNYDTGSGVSSFWRLGRRWWHNEFSEWQLMVPPVATGLSGWWPFVFGVIHVNCE